MMNSKLTENNSILNANIFIINNEKQKLNDTILKFTNEKKHTCGLITFEKTFLVSLVLSFNIILFLNLN